LRFINWLRHRAKIGLYRLPAAREFSRASSFSDGTMMQSSPCFQLTGVATECLAVSWMLSSSRSLVEAATGAHWMISIAAR
jgi:hypothetical protein